MERGLFQLQGARDLYESGLHGTDRNDLRAEDTGYTREHYDATCTEAGYDLYRVRITLTVGEEERLCEKEILIPGEEALGHLFEQGYPTCLREGCSEPNPDYQPEPGEDGEAQKRKQTQTRSLRKR